MRIKGLNFSIEKCCNKVMYRTVIIVRKNFVGSIENLVCLVLYGVVGKVLEVEKFMCEF